MCHRNIRMQSIAPPRQAQLASGARGLTGSVWAKVRACVRACVRGCGRTRACVRARLHALRACVRESSLRVRSYAALVRSAYTCVCEWCMHVRVCVREVGASLGRGKM